VKPYEPPKNVDELIATAFEEATSKPAPEDLLSIKLNDHYFKFKVRSP